MIAKKGMGAGLGAALLWFAAGAAHGADPTPADKVLDCMRANVPPSVRIEDVELTTTDRGGSKRKLHGKLFAVRDDGGQLKAMLRLSAPTDLAGAAYLVLEHPDRDDMFLYLPTVGRVRRINSSGSDGSLMGTDFSYADIKQLQNVFSGGSATRGKDDTLDGRPVYRLSVVPAADTGSEYSRIDVWVDQKSCVALRAELYAGSEVRKRLISPPDSIKKSGNYWYVSQATMNDLQKGTSTVLEVVGVDSGDALASRYFDPHTFFVGN